MQLVDVTIDLSQYYWLSLVIGIAYWLITAVIGDLVGDLIDSIGLPFEPLDVASFVTMFGGFGIGTKSLFDFGFATELSLVVLLTLVTTILIHFFVVIPLKNTETSTSYSVSDMQGKRGVITLEVPEEGYGRVSIDLGIKRMAYSAKSSNNVLITEGTNVLVIEMDGSTAIVEEMDKL